MTKVLSAVAWPYANGPRHIGHVAGFGVPSDVFSRYMRMAGHDVLMVSGTDEHGTPILVAADQAGVTPRELADTNNRIIVEDLVNLGLSYDLFTRTTTRNHYAVVQELFRGRLPQRLHDRADDVRGDQPVDGTYPARPLHRGHLPDLRRHRRPWRPVRHLRQPARPDDLIDPRSKVNGETPQFVESRHFFLDLPALAEALTSSSTRARRPGCGAPTSSGSARACSRT
jgi:methionyl-tRNA synthetase